MKSNKQVIKKVEDFVNYCWQFYAPNEIYGDFFENNLTKDELRLAVNLRVRKATIKFKFEGDTFDREIVRDILRASRGHKSTEFDVERYIKIKTKRIK